MRHRRTVYATVFATLLVLGVGALLAAFVVVQGGLYDVASTRQHLKPVYAMLEKAMEQAVRLRARDIPVPPLDDDALVLRGAGCFQEKCVQCHGAPGVAQSDFGQSMQPVPGPLMDAARRWRERELYWLTRHGIRMSGMPAWDLHLDEAELWAVVAFLERLPRLDAADYAETVWRVGESRAAGTLQACGASRRAAAPPASASVERGRHALYQKACNSCHVIPGITGPETHVGPPLQAFGQRTMVAGVLENTPDNLARWLLEPAAVKPGTAMPAMGLSQGDARDIAAYLLDLR